MLAVTDVRMAGMDGLDTLAALRRVHPHLRSIVIPGYASGEAPTRAIQQHAWNCLYRPFIRDDLLGSVRRVLEADAERERTGSLIDTLVVFLRTVDAFALAQSTDLRDHYRTFWGEPAACRRRSGRPPSSVPPRRCCAGWPSLPALRSRRTRPPARRSGSSRYSA